MARIESDVNMPKLSFCFGLSRRSIRRATVASSMASDTTSGLTGFTLSVMLARAPKSFWNTPSGMTANSSCDWPKIEPFFSFTPMTRKWMPSILMILSSGLAWPNSRSAVPQPSSTTLRLRSTSLGLIRRPRSAL